MLTHTCMCECLSKTHEINHSIVITIKEIPIQIENMFTIVTNDEHGIK